MRCPYCGQQDTHVLDSRPADEKIRRRRSCSACGRRFTTYEIVELPVLMVEKKDGSVQPFDRKKLMTGIFHAIRKRPVSALQVEEIVSAVECRCAAKMPASILSSDIGNYVMEQLKRVDAVAYVRFASVYQEFSDVAGFIRAIGELDETKGED